jgi:hypothetical protein
LSSNKLRCGEGYYEINNVKYIVPYTAHIFSSKSGKLCYLSGLKNTTMRGFNDKYIATVKFIEENRFEEVDYELIKKFL